MSDEPVVKYLHARSRGAPPPTFVDEVMRAVAEAPQRRMSWFARHVPAAVAVGAVGAAVALAAVALILDQGPRDVGPSPQVPLPSASVADEPEASPTSASTEVDGIRVEIELSQGRTAFDRTLWATVTIVNIGSDSVYWEAGGCGFAADVVVTADPPIPVEPGREWPGEAGLLKSRVAAELPGLPVDFRPQELMDLEGAIYCPAVSIMGELKSGDAETYVAGWDGNDARGLPASGGAYTVSATFRYFGRGDAPGPEPVFPDDQKEIGVDIPLLVDTSGADYLSPGEAMDRALADPTFASRLAEAPPSRWFDSRLTFDNARWTLQLQLLDPESCLSATIDGVTGEVSVGAPTASCESGSDGTAVASLSHRRGRSSGDLRAGAARPRRRAVHRHRELPKPAGWLPGRVSSQLVYERGRRSCRSRPRGRVHAFRP